MNSYKKLQNPTISVQGNGKIKPLSSDTCSTIASYLMEYNVSDDIEFSRKAIESLIKKLKDNSSQLDELINSISSKGSITTKCITIPRTLDGRLQVAGRKGFPHVVYVKTFVYPDASKNDLKHKDICQNGFDEKTEQVCVNPYHYDKACNFLTRKEERVPSNESIMSTSYINSTSTSVTPTKNDSIGSNNIYSYSQTTTSFQLPSSSTSTPSTSTISITNSFSPSTSSTSQQQSTNNPSKSLPIPQSNYTETTPYPYSIPPDDVPIASNLTAKDSIAAKIDNLEPSQNQRKNISHERRKAKKEMANYIENIIISNGWAELVTQETSKKLLIDEPLPEIQLSITYYEYHKVLCDTVNVDIIPYYVDGGLNISSRNRLCLGAITNVLREVSTDKVLQSIGRGVRFDVKGEGNIWISNLSNHPVFVQSNYLDGDSETGIVYKISPLATFKVFDLDHCYRQLKRINMYKNLAEAAENFSLNERRHIEESISTTSLTKAIDTGVDDMRNICSIKLSFVKGWGEGYGRERISEVPCWIDVTVNRALQILDHILNSPNLK
ncbi:Smad4 protein [Strongyloides ratti]|uniref:Mothers against decapentaplegic homolog n=1 Tax=Strongyloides ratti TaxID=34506 RepID=A0A090LQ83_STRRB|nr:Smad4 protein [Strongyloides ratti]CEF69691.1 Smad4 protein [Strongyloides ratti]